MWNEHGPNATMTRSYAPVTIAQMSGDRAALERWLREHRSHPLLETARRKAPDVPWHLADLATVDLGRTFECVIAPGNVMIFLTPGSEPAVISNIARHLAPDGLLIAGFGPSSTA